MVTVTKKIFITVIKLFVNRYLYFWNPLPNFFVNVTKNFVNFLNILIYNDYNLTVIFTLFNFFIKKSYICFLLRDVILNMLIPYNFQNFYKKSQIRDSFIFIFYWVRFLFGWFKNVNSLLNFSFFPLHLILKKSFIFRIQLI